jgi:hypothetical protein
MISNKSDLTLHCKTWPSTTMKLHRQTPFGTRANCWSTFRQTVPKLPCQSAQVHLMRLVSIPKCADYPNHTYRISPTNTHFTSMPLLVLVIHIFQVVDNRYGNKSGMMGAEAYCQMHRELCILFNHAFNNQDYIDKESATALLVLQMAHQTKLFHDPSNKRVFFTDNFCTQHTMAKLLNLMTNGKGRIFGTIRSTSLAHGERYP